MRTVHPATPIRVMVNPDECVNAADLTAGERYELLEGTTYGVRMRKIHLGRGEQWYGIGFRQIGCDDWIGYDELPVSALRSFPAESRMVAVGDPDHPSTAPE